MNLLRREDIENTDREVISRQKTHSLRSKKCLRRAGGMEKIRKKSRTCLIIFWVAEGILKCNTIRISSHTSAACDFPFRVR